MVPMRCFDQNIWEIIHSGVQLIIASWQTLSSQAYSLTPFNVIRKYEKGIISVRFCPIPLIGYPNCQSNKCEGRGPPSNLNVVLQKSHIGTSMPITDKFLDVKIKINHPMDFVSWWRDFNFSENPKFVIFNFINSSFGALGFYFYFVNVI
jgi:hypothetical protein